LTKKQHLFHDPLILCTCI